MFEKSVPYDLLPTMTTEEMKAHLHDDNFFREYGNPVVVMDGEELTCVVLSVEYAKRVTGLKDIIEEFEKEHDRTE